MGRPGRWNGPSLKIREYKSTPRIISIEDGLWKFLSARTKLVKCACMDSGTLMFGVREDIRLLTLIVDLSMKCESTQECRVIGHMTSPSNSKVVSFSISTMAFEIKLCLEPESRRHLALCVPSFTSIFTRAVGNIVMVFCFSISDNDTESVLGAADSIPCRTDLDSE